MSDSFTPVCLDADLFLLSHLYCKIHGLPNFPKYPDISLNIASLYNTFYLLLFYRYPFR